MLFQKKASILLQEYHDPFSQQQWQLACKNMAQWDEKKPEKLMLLHTVFHCFIYPQSTTELAQFLTLASHVKSIWGVGVYRLILEAPVPEHQRQIEHYVRLFQQLIELEGVDDVVEIIEKELPNIVGLFIKLLQRRNLEIVKKYPRRNIDLVLEQFATADTLTQFPLTMEALTRLKSDYLVVESRLTELEILPSDALKDLFIKLGMCFEIEVTSAKPIMIAICAEMIRRIYKILPYDTQILSLLALLDNPDPTLKGRIAQIKTGEGKSTILAMLAAVMAGKGSFVDIITSSHYLAIRDCEKYTPFFKALGLSTSHICHDIQKQSHFHAQILYGTNSDFEFALLRDGLNKNQLRYSYSPRDKTLVPRIQDVALIDEVDNMLLDNTGAARIAVPGNDDYSWVYQPILKFVIDMQKQQPFDEGVQLTQAPTPRDLFAGSIMPEKSLDTAHKARYVGLLGTAVNDGTINILRNELSKIKPRESQEISDAKYLCWLKSAQIAYFEKQELRDYVVHKNDIEIMDYDNTGRRLKGCQWERGIHQFKQAQHDRPITPEFLTVASTSHPTYFGGYRTLFGLTGTMGALVEREEVQDIYKVDSFDIPPHRPSQRQLHDPQLCEDEDLQREAIYREVLDMQDAGRPILVLFESVYGSKEFSKFLQSKGISHQLLNDHQRESEDFIIARAGESMSVTVATNAAGRGTDILVSPKSLSAGGLHMVFAFYPKNSRVADQGFGRAGRQGQPGSCCMILNKNDKRIQSLLNSSHPLLLIDWISKNTTVTERINSLNHMRSEQIIKESQRRRFSSQLETLYFNCLQDFFCHLRQLYLRLDDKTTENALQTVCSSAHKSGNPDVNSASFISEADPDWKALRRSAKLLVINQLAERSVDWSSFMDEFKTNYIEQLQRFWSVFYSKLPELVVGTEISQIELKIKEALSQLNLAELCRIETCFNTLKSLLDQVAREMLIENSEPQEPLPSPKEQPGLISVPPANTNSSPLTSALSPAIFATTALPQTSEQLSSITTEPDYKNKTITFHCAAQSGNTL
jgi:preprotein translocase subunit SecA